MSDVVKEGARIVHDVLHSLLLFSNLLVEKTQELKSGSIPKSEYKEVVEKYKVPLFAKHKLLLNAKGLILMREVVEYLRTEKRFIKSIAEGMRKPLLSQLPNSFNSAESVEDTWLAIRQEEYSIKMKSCKEELVEIIVPSMMILLQLNKKVSDAELLDQICSFIQDPQSISLD